MAPDAPKAKADNTAQAKRGGTRKYRTRGLTIGGANGAGTGVGVGGS